MTNDPPNAKRTTIEPEGSGVVETASTAQDTVNTTVPTEGV